jgi:hypothetical protein
MAEKLDYANPTGVDQQPRTSAFEVVGLTVAGFLFILLIFQVVFTLFFW